MVKKNEEREGNRVKGERTEKGKRNKKRKGYGAEEGGTKTK